MLEFFLAYLVNLKLPFILVSLVCGLGGGGLFLVGRIENEKSFISIGKMLLMAFVPLILVVCIPSPKELFEIRLSLIKLELASPENVEKSTEEIVRIAKKLECKYLGCNEDKTEAADK